MHARLLPFAGAAFFVAIGAASVARAQDAARVEAFDSVIRCRAVADSTARLACFDRAIETLDRAEKAGDVVVVDKTQVREARRSAFGFNIDGLKLFDRGAGGGQDLDAVEFEIERAYRAGDGAWVVVTADGQVWRQIDDERVNRAPTKGGKVAIRKAAIGSFLMNIDGQRAVRARRDK